MKDLVTFRTWKKKVQHTKNFFSSSRMRLCGVRPFKVAACHLAAHLGCMDSKCSRATEQWFKTTAYLNLNDKFWMHIQISRNVGTTWSSTSGGCTSDVNNDFNIWIISFKLNSFQWRLTWHGCRTYFIKASKNRTENRVFLLLRLNLTDRKTLLPRTKLLY